MNNSPSTPTPANNNAPVQLGHYQLRDCIGRGGMGLVYRARDTRLERDVAIKCLRTELFEAHYIERFKREALLLAKLNHPNIVQIYDFIEAPEQVALIMELVDGQNMQTYLREHIVPIAQRLQWLVQISEGLAVAHDAGIIHRDLKTENILINKRGQAKITDLGIAKSQDFNATLTDHVAGSYCSMSPEQAMGEAITFKSDLFSLGILAYQLLCGAHPFGDTNNKLQTMQRIITHPPTSPQQHNPDLPTEFIDLLGQLLSKDPDKRPDNTHWVAAQFSKLKELNWKEDLPEDDTQAIPLSTNTRASRTQDHPTFDTRFVAASATSTVSLWQKIKNYLATNKIVVSSATVSFLIIAGVVVWQLQPKPPKYVAVIPPKLTAEGMQESQQELVKEAVYDAIQQGIIQLDNYFLIPRDEVSNISGSIETIRLATAADELITAEIECVAEACNVALTKLVSTPQASRASVSETKTIDILADSYLSAANIIQDATIKLYQAKENSKKISDVTEEDYTSFLTTNKNYRSSGATPALLEKLDQLGNTTKGQLAVQSLYREIALDLFHETNSNAYLLKLERFIDFYNKKDDIHYLYNLHILKITQGKLDEAIKISDQLSTLGIGNAALNEISAHIMMKKNDYAKAIYFYEEALKTKKTANNFFNTGNAYWYSGNISLAKKFLNDSLILAPNFYKSLTAYGQIALIEGDLNTAKAAFEKAIKYKPDDIINTTNLGLTYLLSGQYRESEDLFTKAYALAPNQSTLMLNIADSQNLAGDSQRAKESYLSIINSNFFKSSTNENLRNKSQSYAHLGDISQALTALQQLERNDSQNLETKYTAALVHTIAQNTASAVLNIENVLAGGMSYIWFSFPWFDSLCSSEKFIQTMKQYGASNRCPTDIRSQGEPE